MQRKGTEIGLAADADDDGKQEEFHFFLQTLAAISKSFKSFVEAQFGEVIHHELSIQKRQTQRDHCYGNLAISCRISIADSNNNSNDNDDDGIIEV